MEADERVTSGVAGLDEILYGGFIPARTYLIHGGPGLGKTSLGLHFLAESPSDQSLLITMSESSRNLLDNARRIGLSVDDIPLVDVSPAAGALGHLLLRGEPVHLYQSLPVDPRRGDPGHRLRNQLPRRYDPDAALS